LLGFLVAAGLIAADLEWRRFSVVLVGGRALSVSGRAFRRALQRPDVEHVWPLPQTSRLIFRSGLLDTGRHPIFHGVGDFSMAWGRGGQV
jgi:hypothetical protein